MLSAVHLLCKLLFQQRSFTSSIRVDVYSDCSFFGQTVISAAFRSSCKSYRVTDGFSLTFLVINEMASSESPLVQGLMFMNNVSGGKT